MTATSIRSALKSQYHAALTTLQQTIENCPQKLWADPAYPNPYWQIAFHALYFAHLYLEQNLESFTPWEKYRKGHHNFGHPPAELLPYTKEELLEYCQFCLRKAAHDLDTLDLDHPESGFSWYKMPKLEHQIVNIRHIQHHAAQLSDRLRSAEGIGTRWVRGVNG